MTTINIFKSNTAVCGVCAKQIESKRKSIQCRSLDGRSFESRCFKCATTKVEVFKHA